MFPPPPPPPPRPSDTHPRPHPRPNPPPHFPHLMHQPPPPVNNRIISPPSYAHNNNIKVVDRTSSNHLSSSSINHANYINSKHASHSNPFDKLSLSNNNNNGIHDTNNNHRSITIHRQNPVLYSSQTQNAMSVAVPTHQTQSAWFPVSIIPQENASAAGRPFSTEHREVHNPLVVVSNPTGRRRAPHTDDTNELNDRRNAVLLDPLDNSRSRSSSNSRAASVLGSKRVSKLHQKSLESSPAPSFKRSR